ncbi:MAG: redoxin domain-containing protein [Gammaproteobacteria bacterium]|nr:MAG: redoxin domain-containing protein [Gammaproteobacteria bacterium]
MSIRIGSIAPDFEADSTQGRIRFHQWIGDSWCVLFSHPKDFTPVCTTELAAPNYPLIGDPELRIAKLYEMLPEAAGSSSSGRTPADNQTVRTVFVIGLDKTIKAMFSYPMTTGRNFDEVLRLLDSIQLTARFRVATPVNWKQGEDVIIAGSVSDEEAKKLYPKGWRAPKPYVRIVPPPG